MCGRAHGICRCLSNIQQIRQQAVCARHTLRQLPVKCKRDVDIRTLACPSYKQSTPLWLLPRIMGLQESLVVLVPTRHEPVSAFLFPLSTLDSSLAPAQEGSRDDIGGRTHNAIPKRVVDPLLPVVRLALYAGTYPEITTVVL